MALVRTKKVSHGATPTMKHLARSVLQCIVLNAEFPIAITVRNDLMTLSKILKYQRLIPNAGL